MHPAVRPVLSLLSITLLSGLLAPVPAASAVQDKDDWCDESRSHRGSGALFCEVREYTMPAPSGALSVDGGMNGGIKVEAWDRKGVMVQAKVEVWADTRAEAEAVGAEIEVTAAGGSVSATGPRDIAEKRGAHRRTGWGVSYRVYVPRETDLALETHNGGISIKGVTGHINLEAMNGALSLREVGGDVYGRTTNGSLVVSLDGDRWNGKGLDLVTTNGSVILSIPADYSAALETGTTNGRMNLDHPGLARSGKTRTAGHLERYGRRQGRVRVELGRDGAPVRAITTNGSVRVTRAS